MKQARIGRYQHAGRALLRLAGELRHPQAEAIEQAGEDLLATPGLQGLMFDLGGTGFMDSTVIGVLVGLAQAVLDRGLPQPVLYAQADGVLPLLRSLRLDLVFDLQEGGPADDDAELDALAESAADCSELAQAERILRAHRALLAADAGNAAAFGDLVRMLEQEVERLRDGAPATGQSA